jgi:hypothetical protein
MLTADPAIAALAEEVSNYPNVAALQPREQNHRPPEEPELLVPWTLLLDGAEVSFFKTLTSFGTARDITLAELAIALFYPADEATATALRQHTLGAPPTVPGAGNRHAHDSAGRRGCQTETLNAYEALRLKLRDDPGIDPGAEVRDVFTKILRRNPHLPWTPATQGVAAKAGAVSLKAALARENYKFSSGAGTGTPRNCPASVSSRQGLALGRRRSGDAARAAPGLADERVLPVSVAERCVPE